MAITTTRINGASSKNNYEFYVEVLVNDEIQSDNTFLVNIDAYIVNHGTRTETGGWDKQTIIQDIGQHTDTNQMLDTNDVPKEGGVTLAIRHYGIYRVPVSKSTIYVTGAMARNGGYYQTDPGYCEAKGWVSMPRVMSTWGESLKSIPDITQSFTLSINKYVSSYYNVVEVRNQNNSQLIKTINDAVNGTSVTFTSSELNSIYAIDNNRNQVPLVFYMDLKTYTNSSKTTQIGTTQRLKCEAYIVNGQPTFTYTAVETNQAVIDVLGANPDTVIENFSQMLFTINVTTKNGANVSSVKVNNANATLDNNVYKITIVPISEFSGITVTDSRGLSSQQIVQLYTCPYVLPKINAGWTIERTSPISSDLVLNAKIDAYNDYLNQEHINSVTVQYSLDNTNWVTIPSSSYTYSNYLITITDFEINNAIPYTQEGRFYLRATDLLTQSNENYRISKGIETYSWGENDLQVNGEIYIANTDSTNPHALRDFIIEESGSNANGDYIKFADGTLICWKHIGPVSTYSVGSSSLAVTYPTAFKDNYNAITLTMLDWNPSWAEIRYLASSRTTTGFVLLTYNPSQYDNENQYYNYVAVGRWK